MIARLRNTAALSKLLRRVYFKQDGQKAGRPPGIKEAQATSSLAFVQHVTEGLLCLALL